MSRSRTGRNAVLGATLFAVLLSPASAGAATVSSGLQIVFQAAPGESNQVVVDQVAAGPVTAELAYRVRDSGAPLQAGPGCTPVDQHEAICALGAALTASAGVGDASQFRLRVHTEDGNDSVSIPGFIRLPAVYAGSGDDAVVSRGYGGYYSGGTGSDLLQVLPPALSGTPPRVDFSGGPGNDTIYGSEGDDTIEADSGVNNSGPDPGLEGADTVYGGGGNDRITDSEVTQGFHNVYYGDAGNDVIDAGSGNDEIHGGDGADTIDSYDSSNWFVTQPVRDDVDCGPSVDNVVRADTLDVIAGDCETVNRLP